MKLWLHAIGAYLFLVLWAFTLVLTWGTYQQRQELAGLVATVVMFCPLVGVPIAHIHNLLEREAKQSDAEAVSEQRSYALIGGRIAGHVGPLARAIVAEVERIEDVAKG